jgi:POT family proton-dependent oligopeptide transporter
MKKLNLRQHQTTNIIFITFWSQFASYALNAILILFLTRPLLQQGLGYSQAKAYAFIGVSQATGYLMPIFGGYMADAVLGIRRSILIGSILLACAYLCVMLSGLSITTHGDTLFLAAYALVPAANSLLIGTASGMVSHIHADNATQAKAAMTFYYLAINIGALLAILIAPSLLDSRYGPLSVLTITFIGKAIAASNFAYRYTLYDSVIWGHDQHRLPWRSIRSLIGYLVVLYAFTLFAYAHIQLACIVMGFAAAIGMGYFIFKTTQLPKIPRYQQGLACLLILEAVVFFVIYNQMNSTLVLFAAYNSDLRLFGLHLSPAQYQMLNPILIIVLGLQLPRFYKAFPQFSIPYQFACGTLLAGAGLLVLVIAGAYAEHGLISGNALALAYGIITIAELWVSAIGLSMIGLYCDNNGLAFAMGVWYLAGSFSSVLSGRLADWVAIPENISSPMLSLPIYQHYYWIMGLTASALGAIMLLFARVVHQRFEKQGIALA